MNRHVIIPAAGMGKRFGENIPKALIKVGGIYIIERQLNCIPSTTPVTVIVGYEGSFLRNRIKDMNRSNVRVVENLDYKTTNVVDSIMMGIRYWGEEIVVLDGDVLIEKDDMEDFIESDNWQIGIRKKTSKQSDPVYVRINFYDNVEKFSRTEMFKRYNEICEWACICSINSFIFKKGDEYIYRSLEKVLPIRAQLVDAIEVDTKEDLKRAETWIKRHFTRM